MNPPYIRVEVLHRLDDERFASLPEQKEADTEMGLDLRHPHDNMGQERPTTLFEQKVNKPNIHICETRYSREETREKMRYPKNVVKPTNMIHFEKLGRKDIKLRLKQCLNIQIYRI